MFFRRFRSFQRGTVSLCAQHAEWDLNKIEKTFNRTFADERACIKGSECILFEIADKTIETAS